MDAFNGIDVERHMGKNEVGGNETDCSKSSSPCQAILRSPITVNSKAECFPIFPASTSGDTEDGSLNHQYLAGSSSNSQILNSSTKHAFPSPVAMTDTISAIPTAPGSDAINNCENVSEVSKFTRNNKNEPPPYSEEKYKVFCVDIDPGVNSFKRKKVRCILCSKTVCGGSFKRHLVSQHEDSVSCEYCKKKFNSREILRHNCVLKRKCHKSAFSNENS